MKQRNPWGWGEPYKRPEAQPPAEEKPVEEEKPKPKAKAKAKGAAAKAAEPSETADAGGGK